MQDFDVAIIGAGQAGPPLARALAQAGRHVALIERRHLGGSCVNFGCTPTKAVIASARLAHLARRASEFGVVIPTVEIHFPAVLVRAKSIVHQMRSRLEEGFAGTDNPRLLRGHARFSGRDGERFRLRVADEEIRAGHVVLDTGTRSAIPPIEGLERVDYLDAENWLDRHDLPEHLAIIGGGYIGVEMSQFYRRMGARVTVIHSGQQIADHEDEDVAAALKGLLETEGVAFRLNARAKRLQKSGDGVLLAVETAGKIEEMQVSHVFLAVGRKPNTDDLGLETIGLEPTDKGMLEVDPRLSTRVPGVWAVGDIRGGPMFTHTAWDDYRVVESQLAGDGSRTTTGRVVPYAMFTDPELGRVGLTEAQARDAGKKVIVGRFEMKKNGKAKEIGQTEGFIKVVIDADSKHILGAAVLAAEGAELVHLYADLMNSHAPSTVLENAIMIHPTLAEAVQSAVSGTG